MPLSRIAVLEHLPVHKARALADAVHRGLVETCGVPENDLFQIISFLPKEQLIVDPTYPNVNRTADASIIEILFLKGRTVEQKARLFRAIADRATRAGFKGDDIMVALTENAPADWSAGNGVAFGE